MKRLILALALFLPALALAQPIQPVPPIGSGNGCSTNCTFSGTTNMATLTASGAISGPTGNFATLNVSTALSGAGVNSLFASPPPFGSSAPNTGAFTTLGTAGISDTGGINTTAATGFSINGTPALSIFGQSLYLGGPVLGGGLNTVGGIAAGASANTAGEMAAWGALACQYVHNGNFQTCIGQHAGGYWSDESGSTALGNDSQRDANSTGNTSSGSNTSAGKSSYEAGGGFNIAAFGNSAIQGNSSAAVLSGTASASGSITWTFTCSLATCPFFGAPVAVGPIAITSSETLAAIAAASATAISQNATLSQASIGMAAAVIDTQNILFIYPGTATTGMQIAVTASVTGAGSVAAAITNGFTGNDIQALGATAVQGNYLTTAIDGLGVGQNSLKYWVSGAKMYCLGVNDCGGSLTGPGTTGSNVAALGGNNAIKLTTGHDLFLGGASAGQAFDTDAQSVVIAPSGITVAHGTQQEVILGFGCLQSVATVGNGNILVGSCDSSFGMALSGGNNVVLGHNSEVPTPASSNQLSIMNGIICTGLTGTVTTFTAGKCGFGQSAPGSNLDVNGNAEIGTSLLLGQTGALAFGALETGALGIVKATAAGTAAGSNGGKMLLVCGTTAGSARLVAYAGTSTTPTTILDNIGAGVTGC